MPWCAHGRQPTINCPGRELGLPFPEAGGTQTLTVAAQANCAWQPTFVAPVPSWLTLSSTTERLGAGSVNVTAAVNNTGAARTASIRLGTTVVQVNQQPSACTYAVSRLSVTANPAGETGTLSVTTLAGCGWTAAPQATWVSITSGASGSGSGVAAFSVAAYPGTAPRSTTISVAGYSVAVNQAGAACVPTVSQTTLPASDAGSPTVVVTAATGCGWTGSSPVSWAQLRLPPGAASASVTGNGTANLTVDLQQNLTLTSRSAVLTIAGTSVTVTQAAFACTYTVSALNPATIALGGGSVSLSVTAAAICGWSVVDPPPSWLSSVTPLSGNGNGVVTFTAAAGPNSGRSKAYTVGGQGVLITQAGAPCTYTGTPANSPWLPSIGTTSFVDIAVGPACAAGVQPVSSSGLPLTVTPIAGGIRATYTLPPNTDLLPRTGTITMAGQLVHTAYRHGASQPYQAIESPVANAVLQSGALTLTGYAFDLASQVGPGVSEVQVYVDGGFAGYATFGLYHPGAAAVLASRFHYVGYSMNLTLLPGRHIITMYAYSVVSHTFNSTTAYPVDVNSAPTVTLTGPASGTLVNLGTVLSFTATASDPEGDAVTVTYLANGTPFSPAVGSPFTFTAATAAYGTFAITARATDARGGVTVSAPSTLVINAPPAVTITLPAQGTVLSAGQPFTVAAAASDPDDGVQRVEFSYNGGIPMGTLYAPPYQLGAPSGVPAGTYTISARVFDTRGAWVDATPVTFYVTGGLEVRLGPSTGDGPWPAWPGPRAGHGDPDGSSPLRDTAVAVLAHTLGKAPTRTGRRRRRRSATAGAGLRLGRLMRHGLLSLVVLLGLAAPAAAQVTIEYYHLDPMGSVRMVTDASGDVTQRYDYQVFGEEASAGGQPRKYAGKERDPETGYDYFGGRYYANRLGRFTTVDPLYTIDENLVDPQRWNRYTYVRNNPYEYTDPDGRILETLWDVANVGIGIGSFAGNVAIGTGRARPWTPSVSLRTPRRCWSLACQAEPAAGFELHGRRLAVLPKLPARSRLAPAERRP